MKTINVKVVILILTEASLILLSITFVTSVTGIVMWGHVTLWLRHSNSRWSARAVKENKKFKTFFTDQLTFQSTSSYVSDKTWESFWVVQSR